VRRRDDEPARADGDLGDEEVASPSRVTRVTEPKRKERKLIQAD
jgi:hypothetical protein